MGRYRVRMIEQVTAGWAEFSVATAGAGAALAGLVMVVISVNVREILASPSLPARAGAAVGSLVLVVVTALLLLLPGQSAEVLGAEILLAALAAIVLHARSLWQSLQQRARPLSARITAIPLAAVQLLPIAIGAVLMMLGNPVALYWVAIGLVLTIIGSMLDSWVLMVEILR